MKILLSCTAFLLLSTAAFAGSEQSLAANELFCRQIPSSPDHGYQALFSANLRRVSISRQTIAGPRRVALLNCLQRARMISCSEPVLRDAGYSFSVQANRFGIRGSLFAVTFAGSRRLANMVCQRRH